MIVHIFKKSTAREYFEFLRIRYHTCGKFSSQFDISLDFHTNVSDRPT